MTQSAAAAAGAISAFRPAVKTFAIPMHDVDRALADGEEDGFVKIHVREGSDRVLGATLVARDAGEMINAVSLAAVARVGLRELARAIHAGPEQGAAIRRAADTYLRTRASAVPVRRARRWLRL